MAYDKAEDINARRQNLRTIEDLLISARQQLPRAFDAHKPAPIPHGPLTGTLDEFHHFIEVGEYELAWDALLAVAEKAHAAPACWLYLAIAAVLLHQQEKALKIGQRLIRDYVRG